MIEFDVSELNRVAVDLGRADAAVVRRVRAVLARSAADIEREAKAFAPVDTGALRNSIGVDLYGLDAVIGATANYGGYVEFGTSRMAPHAYMGPAFDRHVGAFIDAVAAAAVRGLGD